MFELGSRDRIGKRDLQNAALCTRSLLVLFSYLSHLQQMSRRLGFLKYSVMLSLHSF